MSKLSRQNLILDLVQQESVANQEQLRKLLLRQGFDVTQATLSRDINELALVKTPAGYSVSHGDSAGGAGISLGGAVGSRVCDRSARGAESAGNQDRDGFGAAGGGGHRFGGLGRDCGHGWRRRYDPGDFAEQEKRAPDFASD